MCTGASMQGFQINLFGLLLIFFNHFVQIQGKRSFIVIAPKVFDVGHHETLHVTILDVDTPGSVSVQLLNQTGSLLSESTEYFETEGRKKLDLYVPRAENNGLHIPSFLLRVSGKFGDYAFDKNQTVNPRNIGYSQLVFLSTDKPFYKPGQTVKFRVLLVDSQLKPPKKPAVGNVWITNTNRIRVAQWSNSTFQSGFLHLEMQLPEEPVLGLWMLHVEIDKIYRTKYFTIEEYVLPTFEVEITPPSYILMGQRNITWNICAKYTYGKPVQGKLLVKISKSHYYSKTNHLYRTEQEIDGCTELTFDIEKYSSYQETRYGGLVLFAQVKEHGTGTIVNSTSSASFPVNYEYTIHKEDSPNYFKAGIPFSTKIFVKKPDSKPFPDKVIKVCASMERESWKKNLEVKENSKFCKSYKTDREGSFVVTIPPQPSNTIRVNVKTDVPAERKDRNYNVPSLQFNLSPWYSSTGHQLQIQPLKSKAKCGSQAELSVLYTSKEAETRKAYYQVVSKGDIVDDGIATYTFDPSEDLSGYTDETYLPTTSDEVCKDKEVWDNNFPYLSHVGKFSLKLDVDFKMSPKAHVLLYSVTEEGNVLADSTTFEVEPCFENSVEMKFSEEKQFPGAGTVIQVSAEADSICSIGVVDKSVYLLHDSDVLTKSQVYGQLRNMDVSEYSPPVQKTPDYNYCSKKAGTDIPSNGQETVAAGYFDAITAFSKTGVVVISDLELETRPCKPYFSWADGFRPMPCSYENRQYQPASLPVGPPGMPGPSIGSPGMPSLEVDSIRGPGSVTTPPTSTVRVYFPETWLWGIYFVGRDGVLSLKEKVPDSITEWQGNAVCLHPDSGLGISDSVSIVAFQPFFTSVKLPYSVVRGETVPIIVTVFNYLKDCLPIRIHLDQTDGFELHNGTRTSKECVCGGKSVTKSFFIKPKTLGELNFTMMASTIKDEEVCENFDLADISRSDSLTKPLLVEAEGIPKEETKTVFFCLDGKESASGDKHVTNLVKEEVEGVERFHAKVTDSNEATFYYLHSPRDKVVEGSERTLVSVTGDVMGPTLEGLERLVRVPTGCGEQNMVNLVPNIVVLEYLKYTNRLTEDVEQKAINNIKQGYVQQQQYRRHDGSYSAFGKADDSGSMWLTAFVVKTFASASRYVDIDKNALEVSRNWIITRQQDNGCFPVIGMVHNKQLKGGVGKEDKTPAILTAYVLSSLLTSGDVPKENVEKALQCIQAMNNPSDYALAIFAYTASLMESPDAVKYLELLFSNAVTKDLNTYWKNEDRSIAIETASYALLASFGSKEEEYIQKSGAVGRWLAGQRNPYGGFVSTQDTVMALGALAVYAAYVNSQQLDMEIYVSVNEVEQSFQLNEENELLMQRIRVPTRFDSIEIFSTAKGKGCALLQLVTRYNIPSPEESEHFLVTLQSQRHPSNCNKATIEICASLSRAHNESNMVVLEMKMVSGFAVVKETVQKLLNSPELEIKRFEIKNDKLNLYFVQLTHQRRCFEFDVVQEITVEDLKPANLKLYDYYSQEKMSNVAYSIEEECGKSE